MPAVLAGLSAAWAGPGCPPLPTRSGMAGRPVRPLRSVFDVFVGPQECFNPPEQLLPPPLVKGVVQVLLRVDMDAVAVAFDFGMRVVQLQRDVLRTERVPLNS